MVDMPENLPTTNNNQLPQKMKTAKNPSATDIHPLPTEILIAIIAALPLKDRKNTRLVCKRWLDVNNVRQIAKKEKFVCKGHRRRCSVELFLQILENSERSILNIDFEDVDYFAHRKHRSFRFWKACGSKIESLSFSFCSFADDTLLLVIKYCVAMQNLSIVNSRKPFERTLISCTAALKEKNLRRERLKSLELLIVPCQFPLNFLKVLFDTYPNLDYFAYPFGSFTKTEIAQPEIMFIRLSQFW